MRSNLLLITHRSPHHAQRSGSSPLAEYLPNAYTIGEPRLLNFYRFKRWLSRVRTAPYGTMGVHKELMLLRYALTHRGGVMHFFHGEHDFHYTGWYAGALGYKTIATFHYPPARLEELVPDTQFLRRLDAAIAVGSNQVDFLRHAIGSELVWCVPLGVDTDYFFPLGDTYHPNKFLFVGQHLRDFDLLGKIMRILPQKRPSVKVTTITRHDYRDRIPNAPHVNRLSGISDEALRAQYQGATCLLLPLKDATACDAILEALACGLPVVTNDVGAVRDYVDESCAVLVPPGDADAMAEACVLLSDNLALNQKMRAAARQRALTLSWKHAAQRHLEIYARLLNDERSM